MDKKQYLESIIIVEEILKEYGLEKVIYDEVTRIRRDLDEYACRVLVIGSFNAGKSAFLNVLLNRDLMEEAQIPETAIAAEIYYDEEEYIEAIGENGIRKRFSISDASQLSPKDWRYLVYHVNCQYLQQHPDLVLVDMPGLDSNLEWHNKAITQYVNRGNAFILMVSCEDGTLRASVRDFLQEVRHYPQDLYCFVSKTDLKLDSEVDEVVKTVRRGIERICGSGTPVEHISARNDPNFLEKAEAALQYFDSDMLFNAKFAPAFNKLIYTASIALHNSADAMVMDDSEISQRIEQCKKNRDNLIKQLNDEKKKMIQKNKKEITPSVISDIENALNSQVKKFAAALMVSPEAFSSAVNSVLRTALYNANARIEGSFADLASELDLSFLDTDNSELQASLRAGLEKLIEYNQNVKAEEELIKNSKRIYEVITGVLAIATNFINPILEILIVMLPSVFSLFSGGAKQEKEEELERKIKNAIIPQIVDRLTPEIENAMQETLEAMLAELETQLNQLIVAEEAALEQAQNEKIQCENDFEASRQEIYNVIEKLASMKVELEEETQ